jgi:hypothetical protein
MIIIIKSASTPSFFCARERKNGGCHRLIGINTAHEGETVVRVGCDEMHSPSLPSSPPVGVRFIYRSECEFRNVNAVTFRTGVHAKEDEVLTSRREHHRRQQQYETERLGKSLFDGRKHKPEPPKSAGGLFTVRGGVSPAHRSLLYFTMVSSRILILRYHVSSL